MSYRSRHLEDNSALGTLFSFTCRLFFSSTMSSPSLSFLLCRLSCFLLAFHSRFPNLVPSEYLIWPSWHLFCDIGLRPTEDLPDFDEMLQLETDKNSSGKVRWLLPENTTQIFEAWSKSWKVNQFLRLILKKPTIENNISIIFVVLSVFWYTCYGQMNIIKDENSAFEERFQNTSVAFKSQPHTALLAVFIVPFVFGLTAIHDDS